MTSRETLDQWATTLDAAGELYSHVLDTVADLPEQKVDLAGSTSIGKPAPLPGGMKLVLAGPHNIYAPPEPEAHIGVFLDRWCVHIGHRARTIPPRRTQALDLWQARLLWLRERLQWIEDEESFTAELRAVYGLLRNVTNANRKSQGELADERERAAQEAATELRARSAEIRGHVLLTRDDAEMIWPVFEVTTDEYLDQFEDYDGVDVRPLGDIYWDRVRKRKSYYVRGGDTFPIGKYPVLAVREVAQSITE